MSDSEVFVESALGAAGWGVHAALAYFYDHRDAIVAEWKERDRLIEAMQTEFPAPPLRPRHRAQ